MIAESKKQVVKNKKANYRSKHKDSINQKQREKYHENPEKAKSDQYWERVEAANDAQILRDSVSAVKEKEYMMKQLSTKQKYGEQKQSLRKEREMVQEFKEKIDPVTAQSLYNRKFVMKSIGDEAQSEAVV